MDQQNITITCLILACFSTLVRSLSIPLGYSPSLKNSETGMFSISIPNPGFPNIIFPIPFLRSQNDSSYRAGLTYHNFDYNTPINHINSSLFQFGRTNTQLTAGLYSNRGNQFQTVSIRYIVIASSWGNFESFYYYNNTNIALVYTTTNYVNFSINAPSLMPVNCSTFYSLTIIDIVGSGPLGFAFRIVRETTSTFSLIMFTDSAAGVYLYSFGFYALSYSDQQLSQLPNPGRLTAGQMLASPGATGVLLSPLIRHFNVMMGIRYFHVNNDTYISWDFTITTATSFSFNTTNVDPFAMFKIKYLIIEQYQCGDLTPYYFSSNNTCLDNCPEGYFNSNQLNCQLCPYDCLTCSSLSSQPCLTCDSANHHRQFNSTNQKCQPLPGYFDDEFNNSVTLQCRNYMENCTLCNNKHSCLQCSFGAIVIGGCSDVPECYEVVQGFYIIPQSTCITCRGGGLDYVNGICSCSAGKYEVSKVCTSVMDCKSALKTNGVVKCVACDLVSKYRLLNQTCICIDGYISVNNGLNNSCIDICGDGRLFQNECDDGNTINGDGCSQKCIIESKYICQNGTTTKPSSCIAMGISFSMKLSKIDKSEGKNQGIFSFSISPPVINLNRLNFSQLIIFSCGSSVNISRITYSAGTLTLEVDYNETIEGNSGSLILKFNQLQIIHKPIIITFPVRSKGVKLIMTSAYGQIDLLKYVMFGLSMSVLVMFVIGSMAHKMIGVQLLHTFTLIHIVFNFSVADTQAYGLFKQLTYIFGNVLFYRNSSFNLFFPQYKQIFDISNHRFSQQLQICLTLIAAIPMAVYFMKRADNYDYKSKSTTKIKQKNTRMNYSVFIYNAITFPFSIGFYFFNTLSITNLSSERKFVYMEFNCPMLYAISQLLIQLVTAFVLIFQWKYLFAEYNQKQIILEGHKYVNYNYIPYYLSFCIGVSIIVCLGYLGLIQNSVLMITVGVGVFLIWLIYARPYQSMIHNVGEIINLITVLAFSTWSLCRKQINGITSQNNETYIMLIIVLLFIACIIATACRIGFQIKLKLFKNIQRDVKIQQNNYLNDNTDQENLMDNTQFSNKNYAIKKLKSNIQIHTEVQKQLSFMQDQINFKHQRLELGRSLFNLAFDPAEKLLGNKNSQLKINLLRDSVQASLIQITKKEHQRRRDLTNYQYL